MLREMSYNRDEEKHVHPFAFMIVSLRDDISNSPALEAKSGVVAGQYCLKKDANHRQVMGIKMKFPANFREMISCLDGQRLIRGVQRERKVICK